MKKNIFKLAFLLSLALTGKSLFGSDISQNMVEDYYVGYDAIKAWNNRTKTISPQSILELTFSLSDATKEILSEDLLADLGELITLGRVDLQSIRNSFFPYASDLANYISSYQSVGKKIIQHKLAR